MMRAMTIALRALAAFTGGLLALTMFTHSAPAVTDVDKVDTTCEVVSTGHRAQTRFHTTDRQIVHAAGRHVVLKVGVRQYRHITATTTLCDGTYSTAIDVGPWRMLVHGIPDPNPIPMTPSP